tara:strand:- start:316 stop:516 length:201 start_codon:yes stop_codon:yes gene_type:complete
MSNRVDAFVYPVDSCIKAAELYTNRVELAEKELLTAIQTARAAGLSLRKIGKLVNMSHEKVRRMML